MKAVICSVPTGNETTFQGHPEPHMGLIALAKYMERRGYGPDQYDLFDINMLWATDKEISAYFSESKPDIAGLSAVLSFCYSHVGRISRLIRAACPDCLIVMGGALAASAETVLRYTEVDICVDGDGEIAWVGLLRYVEKHGRKIVDQDLKRINGTVYFDGETLVCNGTGDQIPQDDLPAPDFEMSKRGFRWKPERLEAMLPDGRNRREYVNHPRAADPKQKPKNAKIFTSKGCVARCTFCQRASKGYRVIPLDKMDELLRTLREDYDVGFINISDENFGSNRKYSHELARLMKKHHMIWNAEGVRASSVNREDMAIYKENDCSSLYFAVESGSPSILQLMEKKFTIETLLAAIKLCAEFELYTRVHVMLGMPGETEETVKETADFLARVSHALGISPFDLWPNTLFAIPIPGTPLYEYGQQIGLIGKTPAEEHEYLLQLNDRVVVKGSYLNINGAHPSEVWFWEPLLRLRAARTYLRLARETPPLLTELGRMQAVYSKRRRAISKKEPTTLRLRFYRMVVEAVLQWRRIDLVPEWLLYPTVKWILYAEFYSRNLVKSLFGQSSPYTYGKRIVGKRILRGQYRSLRKIVEDQRRGTSLG